MVEGNQSQVPKVAGEGSHAYTISESSPINGKLPPDDRLTFPQTHPHSPHSRNGVKEKQTQPVMRSLPERRGWPWDAWEVQRTWSFVAVLRTPAPCPAAGQLPGVPFTTLTAPPCPQSLLLLPISTPSLPPQSPLLLGPHSLRLQQGAEMEATQIFLQMLLRN